MLRLVVQCSELVMWVCATDVEVVIVVDIIFLIKFCFLNFKYLKFCGWDCLHVEHVV